MAPNVACRRSKSLQTLQETKEFSLMKIPALFSSAQLWLLALHSEL